MQHLHSSWTNERVTLQEISMNVSGSQLVMVVGPVGCGKVHKTRKNSLIYG